MANIGEPQRVWEIEPVQEPIGIPLEEPEHEPELVPVEPERRREEVPA